ncbi:hypothetical protein LF1_08220 [Rubripirellula obstinata]|uniref:Uncharacterized protein n=1 Tax=Rubripirellula obstinata TaxID=406547 RepID=A0A5B1CCM3_9BACT|nr:hypothetical protein [Rubripirellula obstinata]KAA1258306.1 hypothetical protein LF1_08220 [Rubripirellula obstinata]
MSCSRCNFYQPVPTSTALPRNQPFGECRRHPPEVVSKPFRRDASTQSAFPIVSENGWCGEFAERSAPLGDRATRTVNRKFDAAAHDDATRGPVTADAENV